jgi:hypothetical protein
MPSLFLLSETSKSRRCFAEVFRQDGHAFRAASFVLNAVDTRENIGAGFCAADLCGQACNGIETNGGKGFPLVGERDFKAIREARESDIEVRICFGEVFERLITRSEDRRLQLCDRIAFEASSFGEVARRATDRRGQTRIGIEKHGEAREFSCHGCWLRRHRKLPGNRGNSRDRPSKGARCAAPCRWCSSVRKCSVLRANHTASNLWELA